MGNTTVTINPEFFPAFAVSDGIRAGVVALAEEAKTEAEALAQDFRETGEYASLFEVSTDDITLLTRPSKRAAGILTNVAPYSAAVEWGNSHHPKAHRVLGRVLDRLKAI
jgi:hypothetical protein